MPRVRCAAAALAAVVVFLFLPACSSKEERRASHLARAQQYRDAGNLPKAQIELRNALQIAPHDPQAQYLLADVDQSLGKPAAAAELYQAIIDADPHEVRAHARLAHLYVLGGMGEQALALVRPALLDHPDAPDLLAVRAEVRARHGDLAAALRDAEHAVSVAPANENAVAVLASVYQQSGQNARATQLIVDALQRAPASVDLHRILADLYLSAGHPDEAGTQLRAIATLNPGDPRYDYTLAQFYVSQHRIDEADRVLKAAIAAQPDDSEPKLAYVDFLAAQRGGESALQAMQGFLRQDPHNLDLRLALGRLQQHAEHEEEALATFRSLIADAPDRPQAMTARDHAAAILVGHQRLDEALGLVAEALQRSPHDGDALLLRGNIELARGDAPAAISDLRAVLHDQPRSVAALGALARAQLLDGNPALAEQGLRAAVEAEPGDVGLRLELSRLLVSEGRADMAVQVLGDAVKLFQQDVTLREELVRAYLRQPDVPAALRAVEELSKLAPAGPSTAYLAGLAAQAQNRPAEAAADFETALSRDPGYSEALAALVHQETQQGRVAEAIGRLQTRAQANLSDAATHELLGELYVSQKNYPQAIEQLQRVLQLAPAWPQPYRVLSDAELARGDTAAATRALKQGIAATGSDPTLAMRLAGLYESVRRTDDAIRLYQSLHTRYPREQAVSNNLAMLLVTYRADPADLEEARSLAASFGDSDDPMLLDTLGWVLLKRGNIEQALPPLERAAAAAPGSSLIRYHLAMAQLKLGQRAKARENLENALAGTADFTGRSDARAALAQLNGTRG